MGGWAGKGQTRRGKEGNRVTKKKEKIKSKEKVVRDLSRRSEKGRFDLQEVEEGGCVGWMERKRRQRKTKSKGGGDRGGKRDEEEEEKRKNFVQKILQARDSVPERRSRGALISFLAEVEPPESQGGDWCLHTAGLIAELLMWTGATLWCSDQAQ